MSFLSSVSVGRGARAVGELAVAVGDEAVATGHEALGSTPTITLDPKITLKQIEEYVAVLVSLMVIHSSLGETHQGHVFQLQRAIRLLVQRARELSAIERHAEQRQAQSSSKSAAADPVGLQTPQEKLTVENQ